MQTKTLKLTRWALLPALLALSSCLSTSTPPPAGESRQIFREGVPGGVILQTFKITAAVTAINHAKRSTTLVQSDGKTFIVNVSKEVDCFDQLQVGDQVNATLTEKVAEHVVKDGEEAGASKGAQPVKLVAANLRLTGHIIAIDSTQRMATLRFDDGTTQTHLIRDDVDISRLQIGEQVVFRVAELTAIKIEKLP